MTPISVIKTDPIKTLVEAIHNTSIFKRNNLSKKSVDHFALHSELSSW